MANCPSCHSPIDEDFGFVVCGGCGVSMMLDMDGNAILESSPDVQHQESVNSLSQASNQDPLNVEPMSSSFLDEPVQVSEFSPMELGDQAPALSGESDFQQPSEEFVAQDNLNGEFGEVQSEVESLESPIDNWDLYGGDAEVKAEPVVVATAPTKVSTKEQEPLAPIDNDAFEAFAKPQVPPDLRADSADFSDVLEFANEGKPAQLSGQLTYSIFIAGIDSPDIKKQLKEALDDKKFVWDIDEILTRVEGGRLRFTELGATKAMIVVKRLKTLPLQIKWEQHDPRS